MILITGGKPFGFDIQSSYRVVQAKDGSEDEQLESFSTS